MRSVWICSRNDAIINLAVLEAGFGVFGTGTGCPAVIVAAVVAALALLWLDDCRPVSACQIA